MCFVWPSGTYNDQTVGSFLVLTVVCFKYKSTPMNNCSYSPNKNQGALNFLFLFISHCLLPVLTNISDPYMQTMSSVIIFPIVQSGQLCLQNVESF